MEGSMKEITSRALRMEREPTYGLMGINILALGVRTDNMVLGS
jgi:hypothetical protein